MHVWSSERQSFLDLWMEQQLRRNQQREERLLVGLVEEHSRSNERLSGLSGISHQTSSTAPYMPTHPITMLIVECRYRKKKNIKHRTVYNGLYYLLYFRDAACYCHFLCLLKEDHLKVLELCSL